MYQQYWQLSAKPFEDAADLTFYYPCQPHQAALLKLRYVVENRRSAALLAGETGLGKSLLVRGLTDQLGQEVGPVVHVVFPDMPTDQLLAYIAGSMMGEMMPGMPNVQQSIRRLERTLDEVAAAGRHALVVVDEAHLLAPAQSLETVRLLTNFQYDGQPAMTVLLVGQTPLVAAVERMPDLDSRMSVKCVLHPFTLQQTTDYVKHRLQAAGTSRAIFEPEAFEAVHYFSQGIARRINRLCDLALMVGFAEERTGIGPAQIEAVARELAPVAAE